MRKQAFKRETVIVSFTFVISLCFLLTGYFLILSHDVSMEQERCRHIAENEAQHILTTIDRVMARINTLEAMVQDHQGDLSFFNSVAKVVYDTVRDETGVALKNLAVAPGGVVAAVYPHKGNEALIGFNFMDLSRPGNADALKAYEGGKTVLTNPFNLVQGGKGMAGRAPVFLSHGLDEILWGLVTVTMDFDNLMNCLQLSNLTNMGINYTLSCLDEHGTHIIQTNGEVAANAVRYRFPVRNLTWELALYPSSGWFSVPRTTFAVVVILVISVFAGMFANMVLKLKKYNKALLYMSHVDRLTRCLNRRAYEDDVVMYQSAPLSENFVFLSADINGLKKVNDTLGHVAGDELICAAAECLNRCLSPYGRVYRNGGDEFVSILFVDENALTGVKEDLRNTESNWKGQYVKSLSISTGFAAKWEYPEASITELAKIADQRMYEAKRMHYEQQEKDGI